MRTSTRLLSAVAALATVLAACGDATTTTAPDDVRVLRVVMADDWAPTEPVVDAADRFEADHPGVEVRIEGVPFSDVPSTVLARISGGEDIALAQWHAFAAGSRGWAEPITEAFDERFDRDTYPVGAIEDVEWDGRIYGVPLDLNAMVMITNDSLLASAGVDPATIRTLDDVADASRAVHASDEARAGFTSSASSWVTYGFLRANGADLLAGVQDGRPTYTFTAPGVVETFDLLAGLARDGAVIPPARDNFSRDAMSAFLAQETALHFSGSWDIATLLAREEAGELGFEFSVWPMPQSVGPGEEGGTTLGGSSLYVPAGTAHADLALDFAAYLTSPETAEALWAEEGRIPARLDVLRSSELAEREVYRAVVDQIPTAHPMRLIAFPQADRLYEDALRGLLSGESEVETALGQIQQELSEQS